MRRAVAIACSLALALPAMLLGIDALLNRPRAASWWLPARAVDVVVVGRSPGEQITLRVSHLTDPFRRTRHGWDDVAEFVLTERETTRVPQAEGLPILVVTSHGRGGFVDAAVYPLTSITLRGGTCLSGDVSFPTGVPARAELWFSDEHEKLGPVFVAAERELADRAPFSVCGLCSPSGRLTVRVRAFTGESAEGTAAVSTDCSKTARESWSIALGKRGR